MFPRLLLLLSLLLPQLVVAEIQPASYVFVYKTATTGAATYSDKTTACSAFCAVYAANNPVSQCGDPNNPPYYTGPITCSVVGENFNGLQGVMAYTCPAGQNWTLSGSNCTRPDCVAPQTRQADGTCNAPPQCPDFGTVISSGQYQMTAGQSSFCAPNGCSAKFQGTFPTGSGPGGVLYGTGSMVYLGGDAQGSCTPSMPSTGTATKSTKPPCADNDQVMTSSSGTVACVPAGTPGSTPPNVTKKQEVKKFEDGSEKVIDITVTCNGQVCSSITTETNTPKTGGGTGSAGTPGTSNTGEKNQGNSDFCANNPGLQICKGGISEEATQKKVLEELQKLGNPGETNYDAVKNAKETDASKEANDTENQKFKDGAMGAFDPIAGNRSAWQQAMEASWFGAIPASGCQPFTGTIGGRSFVIDHCPTAQKISVIAEYAMWFGVVVGIFVMFTGGRAQGV